MARYRIGNDMTILWSITNKDGSPFPLAGKDVHLYYTCERGRYEAAIEIQDNVVSWEFLASRQKALGGYTLTLEVLQSDGKRALKRDLCDAFVLVGKNCEEKFDHDGAHIEEGGIVNLVTSLEVYRVSPIIPYVVRDENGIGYWYVDGVNTGDRSTGESAYEYAKKKGYEGTEEEFAELQADIPTLILDYENYKEQSAEGFASLGRQINALDQNKVSVSDIDSALSTESENPLQNKVVTEELNKKVEGYYAVLASVDLTGKYVHTVPLGIAITDGMEIYIHYREWYGLKKFVLNKANDFYHEEWNETDDYLLQAKYEDGVLTLDEPNNGALNLFELVEVFDSKAIDDNLIPDTISRTADVEDAMGDIEESVVELREETTALWENLDHGTFPDLVAGDLAGRGESVPASFGFRASGGKSIKDGRAYIKRIKGNSVVWNQLIQGSFIGVDADVSEDSKVYNVTPTGSFPGIKKYGLTPIIGHKYIVVCFKSGGVVPLSLNWGGLDVIMTNPIINPTDASKVNMSLYAYKETESFTLTKPIIIDLTKMLQAGNEPTTIEDFNARVATLGVDLNVYNAGQVIHCNTESIKSVGDNAWDEEWENGRFNAITGEPHSASGIRTKNLIKVLPNAEYYCNYDNAPIFGLFYDAEGQLIQGVEYGYNYKNIRNRQFTTPANAATMTFYVVDITTYNHDIMISLVHSGWKQDTDAGYQPYWEDTLPLPIIRKYFPDGMKSVGSAHDEIRFNKASGKWEYSKGRLKSVDLGSLTFSEWQDGMYAANLADMAIKGNILCAKYNTDTYTNVTAKNMGIASLTDKGGIVLYDSAYTTPSAVKADMAGVMLYYESNDWEWVELDAEDQNFRDYYNVADFGTEQSQSSVPSAAFSADIIYQFNAVDMIREHELEITELQKVIATMQAQLASLTNDINDITI